MDDIPEYRIKEYKEAFQIFDVSKDGYISVKELAQVMRSLNQEPTKEELTEMMNQVDTDGDFKINFEEFLTLMVNRNNQNDLEDEISRAFQVFDRDGNGFISSNELRNIFTMLGNKMSEEEIDNIIFEADVNGDGYINYKELIKKFLNK